MKIALVSKLWESTSPSSTGGTGMSVGLLADELVRRGHDVTVFGTGDSQTAAKVVALRATPWKEDYSEVIEYRTVAEAFSPSRDFDIIHTHVEHKAAPFADLRPEQPHLMSLRYGEFFDHELGQIERYKDLNWSTNSQALADRFPGVAISGIVHNGIDLSRYPLRTEGRHLLFLSRLSPQKGPHVAIRVAKALGLPLVLAGKVRAEDQAFLDAEVMPHVDGVQIRYVGEVGFEQKLELLSGAIALLHPNSFFEACSNSILEAQASGVPVVAFDCGSNRELVSQGVTGFVVSDEAAMIEAVKGIGSIDPAACRAYIEKEFSVAKMADGYEALYADAIAKRKSR
jgi:glycosyltransferase involved in cell wall biosynthesis